MDLSKAFDTIDHKILIRKLYSTNLLNSELSKISTWFKCNKLSLNISKTNFIHFKTNNSHKIDSNLIIDGLPLIEKNSTKFLGVTIDSNLTWKEHIHSIHYVCF